MTDYTNCQEAFLQQELKAKLDLLHRLNRQIEEAHLESLIWDQRHLQLLKTKKVTEEVADQLALQLAKVKGVIRR